MGAGTPDSVSGRTSSAPWANSQSAAAMCRAPPAPLSEYGELIQAAMTSTARLPSPRPAASAPRRNAAVSAAARPRSAAEAEDNVVLRSLT
ncbi:hypothetical protein [Streptomyces niveus]|uniref:hypothetical protein n=1 Tax=Streptomyces niveus TaxID=193462 RepID=UPI003F4DBA5C